ncbi:hypothetical protein, partial [Flavihumibacter sp. CACIAM 22H1]|uniref:hypothetical protein n=1 Tax=Flavihumibacter sp. CACIAM 22H1 TaxID=1812911 RepID=UPI0025C009E6
QDAGQLVLFQLQENQTWICENNQPAVITGQIRNIKPLRIKGKKSFVLGRNNEACLTIQEEN